MAHHFVKQPDGKIAIWSTVVDNFIVTDCSDEEAIASELNDVLNSRYPGLLEQDMRGDLQNIKTNGRASSFAPTWDEAIETIRELHGEESLRKVIITDEFVEQVEAELGMGHQAWDMEDPKDICKAALAVFETKVITTRGQ